MDQFRHDILTSDLVTQPSLDLEARVCQYNKVLSELLDKHAPVIERSITLRPNAPWYNDHLRKLKRQKRAHERKWRSSNLEVHRQIYRDTCATYKQSLEQAKAGHPGADPGWSVRGRGVES